MIAKPSFYARLAATAAAVSMGATPAAAIELPAMAAPAVAPLADVAVETGAPEVANQHRYRGHRYRGHRYRGHRGHRGVDAGDVVAGVLVIGAIAAIAGAARERDRNPVRTRDSRDDDYRDGDYRNDRRDDRRNNAGSSGMEHAADMCVEQVERGRDRVGDIEEARRTPDGWRVAGTLRSGDGWSCWIDNEGRIRNVDIGAPAFSGLDDGPGSAGASGEQWDDSAYTSARASVSTAGESGYTYRDQPLATATTNVAPTTADGPQPAYPGGPLPGEEGYDEALQGAAGQGDGRYTVAESPDFTQSGS